MSDWSDNDGFSIEGGEPQAAEDSFLINFLGEIVIPRWNKRWELWFHSDRHLGSKYGADFGIFSSADNSGPWDLVAAIEIERKQKRTTYLFERRSLPLQVPIYTLRYNRGETSQASFCKKYERLINYQDQTFFCAVRYDGLLALCCRGLDVADAPRREVNAHGMARPLEVKCVPREQTKEFKNDGKFLDWILECRLGVGSSPAGV